MPGNEIPENIHNFFEQDNSQGRQSQVGVGGWPILNNNPWVGILKQNGAPVTFNSKNYTSQSSDFKQGNDMQPVQTPFGSNSSQKAELIRSQHLNLNGYMHGSQGIQARSIQAEFQGDGVVSDGHSIIQRGFSTFETQQSNAHGYNSAPARSSERPEATEAPVNFDFLGGQQSLRSQHPGISQPHPIQPLRVSDMQLWQQHLIYKQLKEITRQQQLQQLQQGGKQQNSLSQLSDVGRQASSDQIPAVLSGMPINNASNSMWSNELVGGDTRLPSSSPMFLSGNTNWVQRSSMQGIPNGLIVSHDQGQGMRTMGLVPQQQDQSLYGTPVASTRGPVSHQSPFQGTQGSPHDFSSTQVDIRVGANQTEETAMQSSAFNYFQNNQSAVPGQGYLQDGISLSKQGFNEKSLLQSASMQGVSSGATSENFQQVNHGSPSVQVQEMSEMVHEKPGEQVGPSHGAANLDPTEEKLLFSTADDGNQDVSIGVNNSDTGMGSYLHGDLMQNTDYFSSIPTMHSGSWSALMQEAVEASCSDTGLNEEWSGLSFQKTQPSSGNHSVILHDNNRKQQSNWDNQNLQNASLTSTPLPLFNVAIASSNCHDTPNFQRPMNFSCQQTEGLSSDAFRESFQPSSKEAIKKPFDQSHQQQQLAGGTVQSQMQFSNISNGSLAERTCEQPASFTHSSEVGFHSHNMQHSWAHQKKVPFHSHSDNKLNGWNTQSLGPTGINTSTNFYDNDDKRQHVQGNIMQRTMHLETNHDGSMWKVAGTRVPSSFPSSTARKGTVGSDTHSLMMHNEDSHTANLAVMNSNNLNLNHETNQRLLNKHQVDYGKHAAVDVFLQNKKEKITAKYQNQISGSPESLDSPMHNIDGRSAELCAHKQENNHPEDGPNEGFISTNFQPDQITEGGGIAGDSSLVAGTEYRSLVNSSLKSSGQSGRRNMGPRRFHFHPMGNLEMSSEPIDSQSNTLYSQGPSQSAVQELKNQERGYVRHSQFAGHVLNSADTGKGHLNNLQINGKTAEELQYKGAFYSHSATPAFDGSTSQFPANKRTGMTSQNMLELLHKVDQSRVGKAAERLGFSEQNTSGRREADSSDGPSSQLQLSQSPSFQGFGLKLAPPSQWQSVSDHALPSQTSLETVNDFSERNLDSEAKEDQSRSPSSTSVQSLLPHDTIQKENQGDKSFPSGGKCKEVMHSNFHGNPLAAAAYSLRMNQSVLQQRQQQQQQFQWRQQQQFQWRQDQQQHFSSASASTPNVQSEHHQVGVEAKQSSYPGKIQESHEVATPDQSSEYSPGNTNQSQPRNASSHLRNSGQQIPVVETRSVGHPSAKSAVSQQGGFSTMLHNVWTSVSSQQRLSGVQPQKIISNLLQSRSPLPSGKESLQAPQKQDNHNKRKGESDPSEFGTCSTNSQQFTYGEDRSVKDNASQQMPPPEGVDVDPKAGSAVRGPVPESDLNHHSDGNSAVAISSLVCLYQQDHNKGKYPQDSSIRSVASSNHDAAYDLSRESLDIQKRNSYSLLQQLQAMKGAEPDPTRRAVKRLKGAEVGVDASQMDWAAGQRYIYGQNTVFREMDGTSQKITFPSDVKMLNFSSRDNKENSSNTPLQVICREESSQDPVTYKQHDLQNRAYQHGRISMSPFPGGSERPQISPQMAPLWFEKYGNYKNGQTLTTYDGLGSFQRNAKAFGQNYIFSKVSENMAHCIVPEQKDDASPVGCLQQSTSPTIILSNDSVPSPSHSPLEVTDNNVILIPKKRKSATLDLLPWHKEVTQGCQRLKSISIMEQEWAWATNRITEKLEEEFEMMVDGLSMARSRRRLILTTQLMQQILPPVPRYLSADAATSYESLIYLMAKVILGDACSMISSLDDDSCDDLESGNMNSRKLNISRERDNHFSRFVEDFIGRSKKLENDFLRLERRVSILDVNLECQDLERHSMMNRFAKFHGRAQSEGAENSSTSETAPCRSFPQRHVTAHALSGNLPEGVICLSL